MVGVSRRSPKSAALAEHDFVDWMIGIKGMGAENIWEGVDRLGDRLSNKTKLPFDCQAENGMAPLVPLRQSRLTCRGSSTSLFGPPF